MGTVILNGKKVEFINASMKLLRFIRGVECLKGTKEGCSTGHCGACTVLVNGMPRRSCVTTMAQVEGKEILTIEGLRDHAIQDAFLAEGAVQCGFCTPGMILAAKALLDRKHVPSREEIKRALSANYCRCTGYVKIIKAVESAGRRLYPEEWISEIRSPFEETEIKWLDNQTSLHLGHPCEDMEGRAKVEGRLPFSDDLAMEGMLFARPLFARIPHARIINLDYSVAEKLPGVIKVFSRKDVPGINGVGMVKPDWPVFVEDEVYFYGSLIALVVAESTQIAEKAISLIKVEMEPLHAVTSIEEARQNGDILKEINYCYHDIGPYQKEKDIVVYKRHFDTTWVEHAYLEPESVLAYTENGKTVVCCPTQAPFEHRKQLAAVLGKAPDDVVVRVSPLGGGFGGKGDLIMQPSVAVAATCLNRPVKLTLKREESLFVSTKKHPYSMDYEVGFSQDGTLRYIEADLTSDGGAHSALSPRVIDQSCIFAVGPYKIPAGHVHGCSVRTNNMPSSAMRGFGINQVSFAMETIMDEAARDLGIDPFEIRLRNTLDVGDETFTGERLFASVGAKDCILACREKLASVLCGYEENKELLQKGKHLGVGIATCFKNVGAGKGRVDNAGATISREKDGSFHLTVSGVDMGQGFRTAMRLIAAEVLEIEPDEICVTNGDTEKTMPHGSAVGERQTLVSGKAVQKAAQLLREKLNKASRGERVDATCYHEAPRTFSLGDEEGRQSVPPHQYKNYPTYTYNTQAVILEVDEITSAVRVLEVISANDVGRVINPIVLEGQMEGSVCMGMGYALTEHFDLIDGIPVTKDYGHLGIPRTMDMPNYHLIFLEDPEPNGPFGAKGMSEIGTVPIIAAITNAIFDATGKRIYSIPNSEKLSKAMDETI